MWCVLQVLAAYLLVFMILMPIIVVSETTSSLLGLTKCVGPGAPSRIAPIPIYHKNTFVATCHNNMLRVIVNCFDLDV